MKNLMKFLIFSCFLFQLGCQPKEEETSATNQTPSTPNYSISLDFTRIPNAGLDPFRVTATILKDNSATSGLNPVVSLSKGTRGAITDNGDGTYSFTVTPTQTGEHEVTVSYSNSSITRTPLVLYDVHSSWGQPMAVPGLVNTEGYEDGVTVTSDGEYVFVQTGPFHSSGVFVMQAARANSGCGGATKRLDPTRCEHPWINQTIGPYTAPERPGFFDGRFSGTTLLHNAHSWGVGIDQAPNFAISTMFYGFKRQSDGTYKEPFYLAFNDDNDGIIGPFGLSFMLNGDGTAKTLFTFNDPTDPDMVDLDNNGTDDVESYFDVYQTDIVLGQNHNLGDFVYSGTPGTHPVRGSTFNSTLVNFGKIGINGIAGTQGNSHLYYTGSTIHSIWTDDEYDSGGDHGEIAVYTLDFGTIDSGTWTKVMLPTNVNVPGNSNEIQPYFTGSGLYFTRSGVSNPEVYYSAFSGSHTQAQLANNTYWATPEKILAQDPSGLVGSIAAIGEPTIATINGEEYLYFVYVVVRAYDTAKPMGTGLPDLNFQAGFIKKN